MSKTTRLTLGALALAAFVPLAAQAQTKPPAQVQPKPPAQAPAQAQQKPAAQTPAARALHPSAEVRWNKLSAAAAVLTHEGAEVGRITAAGKKQIDDNLAQIGQLIAKAKQGGISEAEEDTIDNAYSGVYAMLAKNISDVQRKGPVARAVHPAAEARWNKLASAASVLAHEGMEVGRVTTAEKKQIDDSLAKMKSAMDLAKKDGKITEAEEDAIDTGYAAVYALLAKSISDVQRK